MEALKLEDPSFGRGVFIPAAGVPWFVTLFGRDSLVVSMQGISGYPEFAAGALRRLSELQATTDDPERDMEPGKIPHEIRHGELAQLGILPFQPYYGTHDATSLFVIVLSYLYHWLGDEELLRALPAQRRGGHALDRHARATATTTGSRSTRPAPRTATTTRAGRTPAMRSSTQMARWRPCRSPPSSCRATPTTPSCGWPTATTCWADPRTQRRCGARLAGCSTSSTIGCWWEAEGTYYLGLDGAKKPIESVASNAGHLLNSGIVPVERAERVVRRLLEDDMWSGWGIRTLSSEHAGYNPFGYHTGSVWPHDNGDHRGRVRALRLPGRGRQGRARDVRRRRAVPGEPRARAVLRPPPRRGQLPGPVPRRQRARRPGRPARSSASSRSWPGSTGARMRADRGSTWTRPCPTGCPS